MTKQNILSMIAALFMGSQIHAQTMAADAVKKINAIKADTSFFSAESTVKDWETACENARVILTREIEDWLTEHGAADVKGAIATCEEHILEIKTTRGPLYRAFVYVQKDKLYPFTDKGKLVVVDVDKGNITMPTPSLEADEKIEEPPYELSPEENLMLDIKKFDQIQSFIRGLQERGKMKDYGKFASMPATGMVYLFVYDTEGNIPACLCRKDERILMVADGKPCDIRTEYKGCGAFWFQLK